MYTRCPECQTAFRLTMAQLTARDGLVRCGRCDSVFRADLHLFAPPAHAAREPEVESRFAIEAGTGADATDTRASPEKEIPVVTDLSIFQGPRPHIPTAIWALAALVLALLLVGQFAYFYRNELAQVPALRPHLARFCEFLHCQLPPPVHALLPALAQTRIAPHPRYANALRIRASLTNRSARPQPLPLLEVSLTDSAGQLLARRTFTPREYLETSGRAPKTIGPNAVVDALVDVTNPDGKAAGYEVKLFLQQSARAD